MTEKNQGKFDPELIRDLSVIIYRKALDHHSGGGKGSADRMVEDDGDGGVKLRGRAAYYDSLSRFYLEVLKISPAQLQELVR